ncbi:MAG: response regulator [Cyanobacteria bacterium CRU_2_1]|nr:response regulator [Cyanobacteria bacterium RU_5_0]NJR60575.1 response regulator [Cyanobacteria bacterium CRU_2_1]
METTLTMEILRTKTVLLVESNFDFLISVMTALNMNASIAITFQIVLEGAWAVNYMRGVVEYSDRERYPLPDLVLTDVNLPGMSGIELLAWIRQQPEFRNLPVVLMDSNSNQDSINQATELGASSFLVKPSSIEMLSHFARQVLEFLPSS